MNSKQLAAAHVFKASRETCTSKLSEALNLRFLQKAQRSGFSIDEYLNNTQLSCPACYTIRLPGLNSKSSIDSEPESDGKILKTRLIIDCLHCHYRYITDIHSTSSLCCFAPRESLSRGLGSASSSNTSAKKRAKIRKRFPLIRTSNKAIQKPSSSSSLGLETFFKPA